MSYSITLPIDKNTENSELIISIKQNLKNLLLTKKGERIMIPDYGVGLNDLLFQFYDNMLIGEKTIEIRRQIEKYMPFVSLDEMEINEHKKHNTINSPFEQKISIIDVYYSVPRLSYSDVIRISVVAN